MKLHLDEKCNRLDGNKSWEVNLQVNGFEPSSALEFTLRKRPSSQPLKHSSALRLNSRVLEMWGKSVLLPELSLRNTENQSWPKNPLNIHGLPFETETWSNRRDRRCCGHALMWQKVWQDNWRPFCLWGENYKIRFVYLITKHLYVSATGDWEPDSGAPVALRCDVTTLCQRLPSRLIIWLAALTKMVDQRTKSVTNPPQAAIFHLLVWSTSLWTPQAGFHVIIMGWTLLCWCDESLCL